MYDNYLIPANTKNGKLILGIFRPFDLGLLVSGVVITLLLLTVLPIENIWIALLALAPGLICAFLVMPVRYYHNMLNVIIELYEFVFRVEQQSYKWKGWCWKSGDKKEK